VAVEPKASPESKAEESKSPIQINIEKDDTLDEVVDNGQEVTTISENSSSLLQVPKGPITDSDVLEPVTKEKEVVKEDKDQPTKTITHFQALLLLQRFFAQKRAPFHVRQHGDGRGRTRHSFVGLAYGARVVVRHAWLSAR